MVMVRPLARDTLVRVGMHANQMRQRITILDVALLLGLFPDSIEELIEESVID